MVSKAHTSTLKSPTVLSAITHTAQPSGEDFCSLEAQLKKGEDGRRRRRRRRRRKVALQQVG
jgi:hypothetical protein